MNKGRAAYIKRGKLSRCRNLEDNKYQMNRLFNVMYRSARKQAKRYRHIYTVELKMVDGSVETKEMEFMGVKRLKGGLTELRGIVVDSSKGDTES